MTRFVFAALLALATGVPAQVPGELRGRVTGAVAATTRPVADARIEVLGRPDVARTTADGSFVLRGLEPREYTVRVRAVGFRLYETDVAIVNGRATMLEVTLDVAPTALAPIVVRAARDSQPAGVATFDRRAIESSGRRDVGELLQSAPGVVVTQSGGPGTASHASIRGSSANEVLVLVDGVPLNSPITGDADLSRISLESVERVVVRTGAQSARYGGRALAGVVEIQTRRAMRDASLVVRTGAWGERNAAATIGGSTVTDAATLGGSLTADYRTVRGDFVYDVPALRGGGSARRVNSAVESRQVLGGVSFDDGARSGGLRASWQRLTRGLAGTIVQPSITGEEGQLRRDVGGDVAWMRGPLSLNTTGNVTRERATFRDPNPPFGTAYDDTVSATAVTSSTTATLDGDAISASLGVEVRATDLRSSMLAPSAPHWQRLLGAFGALHGTRTIGAETQAAFDLGARVDESSLDGSSAFSPRVAARLTRGDVSASASLGAGYAPPALADQFFREGVLVRPNPSLRPERTRHDVDARFAIRDATLGGVALSGEAAAFRADIDGMILWLPDFRFIWSPSNFAVRRAGWELSGRAALRSLPVDVHGTLNRTDVVYTGPVLSGQVAYRPRTTANIALGVGGPAARVALAHRYVGERRTVPGSGLNVLEPYWRTDLHITSSRRWRACLLEGSLGVDNLLDQPAAMLVDYPFPGRSWSVSLRLRRAAFPR